MSTAQQLQLDPESEYAGIVRRTLRACELAQTAAAAVADGFGGRNAGSCRQAVNEAEVELDRLDNEVDLAITGCIGDVTPEQARDLLTCMKIVIDLERIGDLLSSITICAQVLGARIEGEDRRDLVQMSTVLEKMLTNVHGTVLGRDVEVAIAVLRMDGEIDRLRNLMMIRHLDEAHMRITHDSVQVLFMAQALERAGDHVKNVAEEICHRATGCTLRHVLRQHDVPQEQMYLQYLKKQHKGQGRLKRDGAESDHQ